MLKIEFDLGGECKAKMRLMHGDIHLGRIMYEIEQDLIEHNTVETIKLWQFLINTRFMKYGERYVYYDEYINAFRNDDYVKITFTEVPPEDWVYRFKKQVCPNCKTEWYVQKDKIEAHCHKCFTRPFLNLNEIDAFRLDLTFEDMLCQFCKGKATINLGYAYICDVCFEVKRKNMYCKCGPDKCLVNWAEHPLRCQVCHKIYRGVNRNGQITR